MKVGTEGGEQEGIASQSVEKDVRTDVAGSDIDNLCHACLDALDHPANLKYHVFDKERADPDETRVSFTLDYLAKSSLFTQFTQSTVLHIFCHTIDAMFNRLRWLIKWPVKDMLQKSMPMAFQKHCPKCTVISDCFEVFVERP